MTIKKNGIAFCSSSLDTYPGPSYATKIDLALGELHLILRSGGCERWPINIDRFDYMCEFADFASICLMT
jgi:hypothetical protein